MNCIFLYYISGVKARRDTYGATEHAHININVFVPLYNNNKKNNYCKG